MKMNTQKIDILNRQQFVDDVKKIVDFAAAKKENLAFAINGQWGSGKTFVLDMLEEKLKDNYTVFHFNAWEYDYYDEPLIALLTATIKQLGVFYNDEKTAKQIGKSILKTAVNGLIKVVG